jgi:hypothetical protein
MHLKNYPINIKTYLKNTCWYWPGPLLLQIWQNSEFSYYCVIKEWKIGTWQEIVKTEEDFVMNVDKVNLEPNDFSQYRVMYNAIKQLRRKECKRSS